jgi:hypothetical protein
MNVTKESTVYQLMKFVSLQLEKKHNYCKSSCVDEKKYFCMKKHAASTGSKSDIVAKCTAVSVHNST